MIRKMKDTIKFLILSMNIFNFEDLSLKISRRIYIMIQNFSIIMKNQAFDDKNNEIESHFFVIRSFI